VALYADIKNLNDYVAVLYADAKSLNNDVAPSSDS
jgi:hypothetical protein